MKLSKQIERDVLAAHKAAKAGNSGNSYFYKQLSYRALAEVDRLNELVQELGKKINELMNHDPGCARGHTDAISCAEVAKHRAEAAANPWYCHGATRSGYHQFGGPEDPPPDAQCEYEGCDRTWGELLAAKVE